MNPIFRPADSGEDLFAWAIKLMPFPRSLTGDGVRETLDFLGTLIPGLQIHEVQTGTQVLDWIIPDEWNFESAYVEDMSGYRVIDSAENLLHVVGYSEPIDQVVSRQELDLHLHSLPEQPQAVPYVTSYYARNWGFCLAQNDRDNLGEGPFRVVVNSRLGPGSLSYADLVIPGESTDEVLLTTYVCHPNMANNELSGPVVLAAIARMILSCERHRYTYRILFAPETIGSIAYLSKHLSHLKKHVKAGWVLSCLGDERNYSFVPSRLGSTLADKVSLQILNELAEYTTFSFLDRGSDERQWCAPGVDLPVCSVMRSKYGTYPEYHTSLDTLGDVVTADGLQGGLDVVSKCLQLLERNQRWATTVCGEPHRARRNLFPKISIKTGHPLELSQFMNVLAYCDGNHDVIDIARTVCLPWTVVAECIETLNSEGLIIEV